MSTLDVNISATTQLKNSEVPIGKLGWLPIDGTIRIMKLSMFNKITLR